jgi:hypothetical protein
LWLPALSIDTSILTYGPYPVSVDDRERASPGTVVALGSRTQYHPRAYFGYLTMDL